MKKIVRKAAYVCGITLLCCIGTLLIITAPMIIASNIATHYAYGAKKDDPALEYGPYFERSSFKYYFDTVLLTHDGTYKGQSGALIYIKHLSSSLSDENNELKTKIVFNLSDNLDVNIKTIHLNYEGDGLSLLRETSIEKLNQCLEKGRNFCQFVQIYTAKTKPDQATEHLNMTLTVDNKPINISREVKMDWAASISLWDQLMGI